MKLYGLIGYPIAHSFSAEFFAAKFMRENIKECVYKPFPIKSIDELPGLINENPDLIGLSVTIPYKEKVLKYIDELEKTAAMIGAVNTIRIERGSEGKRYKRASAGHALQTSASDSYKLYGFNTDAKAFKETLHPLLKPYHTKALILGTGGASKAVAYILNSLKIEFQFVSRNPEQCIVQGLQSSAISYKNLDKSIIENHLLIINTSPVGMFPNNSNFPDIPYEYITEKHLLYDLIYNPSETEFLRKGKSRGALIQNGLLMLHLQAEKAWGIWNNG